MSNINTLIQEIKKGINLEGNLTEYLAKLLSLTNDFSTVRLSMNYLSLADTFADSENVPLEVENIIKDLNTLIKESIIKDIDDDEIENSLIKIEQLRERLIQITEIVTSYIDVFKLHEYIINRNEYRFKQDAMQIILKEYDDKDFTDAIINYIANNNDNVVVNKRILEVVSQLPVRITKGKFFEYLYDAIRLFKEGDVDSLEAFVYNVNTSAGVFVSKNDDFMQDIEEISKALSKFDYKNMNENDFKSIQDDFTYGVNLLNNTVDLCVLIQNVINDVYSLLLSYSEIEVDHSTGSIYSQAALVYSKVNAFMDDLLTENIEEKANISTENLYHEIKDNLKALVGKQEETYVLYLKYMGVFETVKTEHIYSVESLGFAETLDSLTKIDILLSESIFVSLSKKQNQSLVTEEDIERAYNKVVITLTDIFNSNNKDYNKAVMGTVLSILPVFFNSLEEIKEYTFHALTNCTKKEEKAAVVEVILRMIMQANKERQMQLDNEN